MTQRVISDLESAISRAKKSGFDQSKEELANEVETASDLLLRLKRLEKLRSEVGKCLCLSNVAFTKPWFCVCLGSGIEAKHDC